MTTLSADGYPPGHDPAELTDGYHTMQDLYDHRRALTAALAAVAAPHSAYRTRHHHPTDTEPMHPGYFLVSIHLPGQGEIRYHYPIQHWDDFAAVPEVPYAAVWDGATPADNITRLLAWCRPENRGRPAPAPGVIYAADGLCRQDNPGAPADGPQ